MKKYYYAKSLCNLVNSLRNVRLKCPVSLKIRTCQVPSEPDVAHHDELFHDFNSVMSFISDKMLSKLLVSFDMVCKSRF